MLRIYVLVFVEAGGLARFADKPSLDQISLADPPGPFAIIAVFVHGALVTIADCRIGGTGVPIEALFGLMTLHLLLDASFLRAVDRFGDPIEYCNVLPFCRSSCHTNGSVLHGSGIANVREPVLVAPRRRAVEAAPVALNSYFKAFGFRLDWAVAVKRYEVHVLFKRITRLARPLVGHFSAALGGARKVFECNEIMHFEGFTPPVRHDCELDRGPHMTERHRSLEQVFVVKRVGCSDGFRFMVHDDIAHPDTFECVLPLSFGELIQATILQCF